jgi:hypothetical protein
MTPASGPREGLGVVRGAGTLAFDADPFEKAFGQLAGPLHWPSLSGDEAAHAWTDLRAWVDQLVVRFAIEVRVIPPCWQQHNGMVEALSALRDHERASYADTASPTAAVDWFRALREIETRLVELASKTQCSTQQHREEVSRSWVGPETV